MLVRNRVRELNAGQCLRVEATDPSTERDLKNFCRFMGHELVSYIEHQGIHEFLIRKTS